MRPLGCGIIYCAPKLCVRILHPRKGPCLPFKFPTILFWVGFRESSFLTGARLYGRSHVVVLCQHRRFTSGLTVSPRAHAAPHSRAGSVASQRVPTDDLRKSDHLLFQHVEQVPEQKKKSNRQHHELAHKHLTNPKHSDQTGESQLTSCSNCVTKDGQVKIVSSR